MWPPGWEVVLTVDREAMDTVVAARWCDGGGGGCASSSEGDEEETLELTADAPSGAPAYTLAQGARVRRVGPRSGRESSATPLELSGDSWRRGSVSAQFSQGPARLVT